MQIIYLVGQCVSLCRVAENLYNSQFTTQEIKENLLLKPDGNESGLFIQCNLDYPSEISKKFPFVPLSSESISRVVYNLYEQCKTNYLQINR